MRVQFYSINVAGKTTRWDLSIDDLMDAYWNEGMGIPANDDLISNLYINTDRLFIEGILVAPTFGDLIVLLGIDE